MFVIEKIFIEDKKLAQVLTVLAGLVLDMPAPKPVVNAETTKAGKVKAISPEGGSIVGRVAGQVQKFHSGHEFTVENLKDMIKEAGGNPNSIGTIRAWLTERKLIKSKSRGLYTTT